MTDSLDRILDSLEKMGMSRRDIIISTNVPTRLDGLPRSGARVPDDPGAAVYWTDTAAGWREMFGFGSLDATIEDARAVYRSLAKAHHPDRGGDPAKMVAINLAWEQAQAELVGKKG